MNKQETLKKYFGYSEFRKGQEELIDNILSKRDVLGILPTGAGKSLCYQIPALMLEGITVVVSPLISLMKDQVRALNEAGVHAAYINSSLTENQIRKAMEYAMEGRYKIIYAAPERLETSDFIRLARTTDISMVTIDEAHCISQWGQDFRPSYLKIVSFINNLRKRPVISAFTATATREVKDDITCVLGLEQPYVYAGGFDRENLYFSVQKPKNKLKYVSEYIKSHNDESGIIYCATRKNVEKVYDSLLSEGVAAAMYHGGLSGSERNDNQEAFIYDVKPVMVATNAFGMGIDKSNVRYVIHYNMPQSMENYYQEAGRAGRDGETAECVLLYSGQDVMINRLLIESKDVNSDFTPEQTAAVKEHDELRLQQMNKYCMTTECLRSYILNYFGEYINARCENCSNCQMEYEETDRTEEAKAVISCVSELGQRFGINVVAGTLHGHKRAKLMEYHVDRYNSYGKLENISEEDIKHIINRMIEENILTVTQDKYSVIKLKERARDFLFGNERFIIKQIKADDISEAVKSRSRQRRSDVLNGRGLDLFESLRELRLTIAKEESVPPYIVFSDKTLTDMCIKIPFTKEEMLDVSGVGENKYEKYGERFISAIFDFTGGRKEKTYFGSDEVSDIPKQVTVKKTKQPKEEFYVTERQAASFPYSEKYLATEIAVKLTETADTEKVKKLTGADIFRYVKANGWADEVYIERRRTRVVYDSGLEKGIFLDKRVSAKGKEYEDIYYSEKAQKIIVEHYVKDDVG
ncbi:MAG: DNA helicase RecQ [Lachnospiraceae bacterium]